MCKYQHINKRELDWHNSYRCPGCGRLYDGKECGRCGYVPRVILPDCDPLGLEPKDWDINVMTHQDEQWNTEFGDDYTNRNLRTSKELDGFYKNRYGVTRTQLNKEFLVDTKFLSEHCRILEVGCNIGTQLTSLREMGFKNLYGLDINRQALRMGRLCDPCLNLNVGNVFNIPFKDEFFDMVMTNGVLIHIPPDVLYKVVNEICRVTRYNGYIYCLEYYTESFEPVVYKGKKDMLWKGDYPGLFDGYHIRLIKKKERVLEYLDGSGNRDVVFIFKKVGGDST